jgi:hypothetical protein
VVPWTWIADETRQLHEWEHAPTVAEFVRATVDIARVNPWPGEPPLMLVESRSLGGVVRAMTSEYLCSIAATNGQVGGFLHTDVAQILQRNDRMVLCLGNFHLQGHQIEANTRHVMEHKARRRIDWNRIAITEEQIAQRGLRPILKKDHHRFTTEPGGAREFEAWECEALGQGTIQRLVRDALEGLLPEPLSDVVEVRREQRARVAELLDELDE